jgi:hypothetical protein
MRLSRLLFSVFCRKDWHLALETGVQQGLLARNRLDLVGFACSQGSILTLDRLLIAGQGLSLGQV